MRTLWQNITYKMLRSGSRVNLLIWINVVVYLLINVPAVIEQLFTGFGHSNILFYTNVYLLMPANLHVLLHRFWTPITYMFMHATIFHILFNMLWLYWIGQIFEDYLGNKRSIGLYMLGGLSGASLFLLCYNVLPAFTVNQAAFNSVIVGASAGVMAIIIATATLLPDYTLSLILIGPVKLKWLALFFVIVDFLSIAGPNAGGEISHLGGALFGFVYIKQLQKGNDWVGAVNKWFEFIGRLFTPKSKLKVVSKNPSRNSAAYPRQDEIDQILDKISKTGYDSLSKQEKEILFRASNEGK